jgi:hypothetical protein
VPSYAVDQYVVNNYPEDFIAVRPGANGAVTVDMSFIDLSPFLELDSGLTYGAIANEQTNYDDHGYVTTTMFPRFFVSALFDIFKTTGFYPTYTVTMSFDATGKVDLKSLRLARTKVQLMQSVSEEEASERVRNLKGKNPIILDEIDQVLLQMGRIKKMHTTKDGMNPIADLGHMKRIAQNHLGSALVRNGYPTMNSTNFSRAISSLPIQNNQTVAAGFEAIGVPEVEIFHSIEADNYETALPSSTFFTGMKHPYSAFDHSYEFRSDRQLRSATGLINGHAIDAYLRSEDPDSLRLLELRQLMDFYASRLNQPFLDQVAKRK